MLFHKLFFFCFPDKSFIEKEALREAEKIFYSERNKELVEKLLRKTPKEALDSVEFKVNAVLF